MYPRQTEDGELVSDDQLVGLKEHMITRYRIMGLYGPITGDHDYRAQFRALDSLSHEPIYLFIASPGGDLDATFLLYDTMKFIQSPIITIGEYCASAAAILLASGSKRYLLPHAKVMLHLPAGQMAGDARDWDSQNKQMQGYKNKIVEILIACGARKSHEEILTDIDREFWLDPPAALEYGLADEILTKEIWQSWIKEA